MRGGALHVTKFPAKIVETFKGLKAFANHLYLLKKLSENLKILQKNKDESLKSIK